MLRGLVIAALAALLACSAASAAPAKTLRVLYIGDSLTDSGAQGFPYVVTAGLKRRGNAVTQILVGKGGVKAAYWPASRIPRGVDIAVVELGTNDTPWTTVDQFAIDYKALIARIRVKSPHARFVCLSVWAPGNPPTDEHLRGKENAPAFDAIIKSDCPGRYVNIERFAHPPNLQASDGFHPNPGGHRLIGNAILYALR